MRTHKPFGWNTWDFRGFNRFVYLDHGKTRIIVEYSIWDEGFRPAAEVKNRGGIHHAFRWSDVVRLGPHAPLGLPAVLELKAGDTPFRAEAEDEHGTLRLTIAPLGPTKLRVVFRLLAPIGETPTVTSPTRGAFARCKLELTGAAWPGDYFLNIAEPYALGQPGEPATLRVRPIAAKNTASGTLAAYERERLGGAGALADAPEVLVQAVTWNTLYDTRRQLVSSPVSRDWCADWKGVTTFCWDTFLVGAMISYESPALARLNFEAVSAAIDELGMTPNYYMSHGAASRDRSMPPLGAYMIWRTQVAAPDRTWLRRIFPRLRRWHRYWPAHRDARGDGLLAWGSDAQPHYEFPQLIQDNPQLQHSAKCAMYESGLDNSPMYDDVPFVEASNTLALADVGLCAYYAMDCEALAAIADCIGLRREAAAYRGEWEQTAARINEHLWDDERGIYANRHWQGTDPAAPPGEFSTRWSPTSFFPLFAGVAPRDRAERLVREHLLNEREFWGPFVLPSISRSDPAFPDNDYWRGRIWGPFNFLVAEGLRRYRFDETAAELARRSLDLFMRNWRADGGIYENYNAATGEAADVWNAARLYHWGGLLAFIAMQELIDAEPAGWLRLGSLHFPAAELRNVRLGDSSYDVDLGRGLRVERDGATLLQSPERVCVRLPLAKAGGAALIEICAGSGGTVRIADCTQPKRARLNGEREIAARQEGEALVFSW